MVMSMMMMDGDHDDDGHGDHDDDGHGGRDDGDHDDRDDGRGDRDDGDHGVHGDGDDVLLPCLHQFYTLCIEFGHNVYSALYEKDLHNEIVVREEFENFHLSILSKI
ncbi:hypothetical protein CEXT_737851 [Caerostris extrusa]|uniref:Uncharacterized protein n=1 Tax=Caerostris extrusa TaxID=172846 RepID=A0AAV4XY51_CAEEX|nr:hypothetical protein CEXT_737851 [Caerostris extrusa]